MSDYSDMDQSEDNIHQVDDNRVHFEYIEFLPWNLPSVSLLWRLALRVKLLPSLDVDHNSFGL